MPEQNNTNTIDYFLEQTLEKAKDFNLLRQNLPGILSGTGGLISSYEGTDFCNQTMQMPMPDP